MEDRLLTVKEVAKLLKVSENWVYTHWQELGGFKLPSKGEKAPVRFFEKTLIGVLKNALQKNQEWENSLDSGHSCPWEEDYKGMQNKERGGQVRSGVEAGSSETTGRGNKKSRKDKYNLLA